MVVFVATKDQVMKKRIAVSSKRQITIPKEFFSALKFGDEAECVMYGKALIIRPVGKKKSDAFEDSILADLLKEEYGGDELLNKLKETQEKVSHGVKKIIKDVHRAAKRKSKDLFD